MAKETPESKAGRLLAERKVTLVVNEHCEVLALVQGSEKKPYEVTGSSEGWTCTCVATVPYCSHRLAVAMVACLRPMGSVPPSINPDVPF